MAMHDYPYIWNYIPLALQVLFALGIACGMVGVSFLIGKHKNSRTKSGAYECGMDPIGDARGRFSVRFYLVAMLFILFDIEIVFLYPLAAILHELSWFGFFEFLTFLVILLVAYVYIWRKGALEWR